MDLVFILHCSHSMRWTSIHASLLFILELSSIFVIDGGSVRIRLMVIRGEKQHMSREIIQGGIGQKYVNNITILRSIDDALKDMRKIFSSEDGDRQDIKNVCILITNGNMNVNRTITEADRAKQDGIFIYTFGIIKELNQIANKPLLEYSYYDRIFSFKE